MEIVLRCEIPSKNKDAVYILTAPLDESSLSGFWGRWSAYLKSGRGHLQSQVKYPVKPGKPKVGWSTVVLNLVNQKHFKGYKVISASGVPYWLVHNLNSFLGEGQPAIYADVPQAIAKIASTPAHAPIDKPTSGGTLGENHTSMTSDVTTHMATMSEPYTTGSGVYVEQLIPSSGNGNPKVAKPASKAPAKPEPEPEPELARKPGRAAWLEF